MTKHPHRFDLEALEKRVLLSAQPFADYQPFETVEPFPLILETLDQPGEALAEAQRSDVEELFNISMESVEPVPNLGLEKSFKNAEGSQTETSPTPANQPPTGINRPILIVPGIAGTFAAPGAEEAWYTQRGIDPEYLKVDPLAGFYNDVAATLINAAGYTLGDNLFEAAYDWRMAPGPAPDNSLPQSSRYDGVVTGLTEASLTDEVYEYGVDYLAYWMKKAQDRWEELYGVRPTSVDLITHSTGGLVARTYIQSDAYPTVATDSTLPTVENFFMVAVPNRGAPKAWNPLQNNFGSDIAYQLVLSKAMNKAYEMYLEGEVIKGADGDIFLAEGDTPMTPQDFIVTYVPTIQSLLATYEFLIPEGGSVKETANSTPFANDWILDLNDGLDFGYSMDDFANGTSPAGKDPNAWVSKTGTTYVYYTDGTVVVPNGYASAAPDPLETVSTVRGFRGTQGPGDNVTYFDEFYGHIPGQDEIWYRDESLPAAGDGTVPTLSSLDQFSRDPAGNIRFSFLHVNEPLLDEDGAINMNSVSHTGIMSNRQMQSNLMTALGVPFDANKISTDQANSHEELLAQVISLQILDPAELLIEADWDAFPSFAINTGLREALELVSTGFANLDTYFINALKDEGIVSINQNPLEWSLPFTTQRMGDLFSFQTVFDTYLAEPTLQYLRDHPDATSQSLKQFIANDLGITVSPSEEFRIIAEKVAVGAVTLGDAALRTHLGIGPEAEDLLSEIVVTLPFEYTKSAAVPLDFGNYAGLLGFQADASATIDYGVVVSGNIVIGYDMRPNLSADERPFFRFNEIKLASQAQASSLNAGLNVGILGTQITNGSVQTEAGIRIGLSDSLKTNRNAVTKQQLQQNGGTFNGALEVLASAQPYASMQATLPLSVSYPGLPVSLSPVITFNEDNIFDGKTNLTTAGFGDLIDFTSLSLGSIEDAFETVAATLDQIVTSPALQSALPFVANLKLSRILDLAELFNTGLIDKLRNEDGSLTFTNLQEFIALVNGTMGNNTNGNTSRYQTLADAPDTGGIYDSANKNITFSLGYEFGFLAEQQRFDFAYNLSPLQIFTSGSDLSVGGAGQFGFELALGMQTPVAAVTADSTLPTNGILANPTTLSILFSGGLLSNGQFVDIPLQPDNTNNSQNDLIDDINAALSESVLAGMVAARVENGKLVIETILGGPIPAVTVSKSPELGFNQGATDTFQPAAVAELSNLSASLSAGLLADQLSAGASIGFLGIFINDGSANLTLDFHLDFLPNGPLSVKDLFLQLANNAAGFLPTISLSTSGQILLRDITVDGDLINNPDASASIELTLASTLTYPLDPLNNTQFSVNFVGDFSKLLDFRNLGFAEIISIFRDALSGIQTIATNEFLNTQIPFTDGTFNELLQSFEEFAKFIDKLAQYPLATIQDLAQQLTSLIQEQLDTLLPNEMLEPSVILAMGNDKVLTLDILFLAHTSTEQQFALDPLGAISGLGNIVDLRAESTIKATLTAWIQIVFGIDLTDPLNPVALLKDGTEAVFEILLAAENINFAAAAPLGFFIRNGYARIDDGTNNRAPAKAAFSLNTLGAGSVPVSSVSLNNFSASIVGEASANLPVHFPDENSPALADPIAFTLDFNDPTNPAFSGPNFDQLFASLDLFDFLSNGVDLLFLAFEEVADGDIFGFDIPFVGDQLASAATFILELRDEVQAAIDLLNNFSEQSIEQALFDALGPSGLDFLLPLTGSGLPTGLESATLSDVKVTLGPDTTNPDSIEIELRLGKASTLLNADIAFDDGLPGLNLTLDTVMEVLLAWEWNLVFGVTRTDGFYVKSVPGDELKIKLDAGFPNTDLQGSIGFIGLNARERPGGEGIQLSLNAGVDLPTGTNGKLTLGNLTSGQLDSFNVTLDGFAVLDVVASIGFADLSGDPVDALPTFLADFYLRWDFVNASVGEGNLGQTPIVRFDNIRLDVGTFFSDFLRPIVQTVASYLEPLRPVVDFLTTDLKFLNWDPVGEIFDQNDDGKVTVLDLADLFFGTISPTAYDFLDAVDMIFSVLDILESDSAPGRDGNLTINLGSYNFNDLDLRSSDISEEELFLPSNFSQAASTVGSQFGAIGGVVADVFAMTQTGTETSEDDGEFEPGVFRFLLLEPENLIRLIMGQKIDFFTYTLPELTVEFAYSASYIVWTPPVVKVRFGFLLGFSANMTFGYDSSGVEAYLREDGEISDLFGGFYIAVGENVPPILSMYGNVYGGVSVGVGLADIFVDIGAGFEANFSLVDPGEGKLYLWQVATLIKSRGLFPAIECLFIAEGEIYGFARLGVEVGIFTVFEVEVARVTFWEGTSESNSDCFTYLIPDRLEQPVSGQRGNDALTFAADIGVAPGIHLRGASISSPGDIDFYRFELLKSEQLEIDFSGDASFTLTIYDSAGMVVAALPQGTSRKKLTTRELPVGEYFIQIEDPDAQNYATYTLDIITSDSSTTRVFYVNSPASLSPEIHSFYALAPGDDTNTEAGLDPTSPAATVDHIFAHHAPDSDDIILLDSGAYVDAFNVSGGHSGVFVAGAPDTPYSELPQQVVFGSILSAVSNQTAASIESTPQLTLAGLTFADSTTGLKVAQSDGFTGYNLIFEENTTSLVLDKTNTTSISQSDFSGNPSTDTAVTALQTTGLSIADSSFQSLKRGIILTDTTGTELQSLSLEQTSEGIFVDGGSGLTLSNIILEGAEVSSSNQTIVYNGEGQTGINVINHTGLQASGVEINRFRTAIYLNTVSNGTFSGVYTIETGVAFAGLQLSDISLIHSTLRTQSNGFAIEIGDEADASESNANLTFQSLQLGVLPAVAATEPPELVHAKVFNTTNLTVNATNLHGTFSSANITTATWTDGTVYNGSLNFANSSGITLSETTLEANLGAVSQVLFDSVDTGQISSLNIRKAPDTPAGSPTGILGGVGIELKNASNIQVTDNTIERLQNSIRISADAQTPTDNITIDSNTLSYGTNGIFLEDQLATNVLIQKNSVSHFSNIAIHAVGFAQIHENSVSHSKVGLRVESSTPGLRLNEIFENQIGVTGNGYLGNNDRSADQYNDIHNNLIGIVAEGNQSVAFNKLRNNGIGIQVLGNTVEVHHNIVHENLNIDLQVKGSDNTSIVNNTIYSTADHALHLTGGTSFIDIRNNIVWNSSSEGIVLAVDSSSGDNLTSDYNNYYASDGATLFEWTKSFDDLLDWQIGTGLDLNSIGTTRVHPLLDKPQFVDLENADFRILDLTASTINAGDPSFTFDQEQGPSGEPNGLRINLGAFGDTELAALSPSAYVRILSPNYYVDYPQAQARLVSWESFNIAGNISLELIEATNGKVADIVTVPFDNKPSQGISQPSSQGAYLWSPQMSNVMADPSKSYFIRVVSADDANLTDQNREPFSIVARSDEFFVNDSSISSDVYTTVAGDNRFNGQTSSTPKASIFAILTNYSLSAGQVVNIDSGTYVHLRDVLLGSDTSIGNHEAFTLQGPTSNASLATFDRANPRPGAVGILLDNAAYVTIQNLTLQGGYTGIKAINESIFAEISSIDFINNPGIQLHITGNSTAAAIEDVRILNGGDAGITIENPFQYIRNSTVENNTGVGIHLTNSGNAKVENNTISGNSGGGIYARNTVNSTLTTIGNADLSQSLGNNVHNNSGRQVEVRDSVLLVGNSIYHIEDESKWGTGIGVFTAASTIAQNTIFGHETGVYINSTAEIQKSRIYANSLRGIAIASPGATITQSIIYSSPVGIEEISRYATGFYTVRNSILYDLDSAAFTLQGANGYVFENNTVSIHSGDALRIRDTPNGTIINSIFDLESGTAFNIDSNSQAGFQSNYNLFDIGQAGVLGTWAGGQRVSLKEWMDASFIDKSSLEADPLFVSPNGADSTLGYDSSNKDGSDDNFHVQSLSSSDHGGTLAPIFDASTGLPVYPASLWVADAQQSPAIDRGSAAYDFSAEPVNNGNFINIGAYGNTAQASRSPSEYVLVISPAGGETWPIDQTFPIQWRSHDLNGSVDIFLWEAGKVSERVQITNDTENDGTYEWLLTDSLIPGSDYFIGVERTENATQGQSLAEFSISEPINFYYVNDAIVSAGDYTTAPGNNANNGLSPSTPKASIRAVLEAYDLAEGDVVIVDAGEYAVTTNILLSNDDSGVTIRGFFDPNNTEHRTVLNRQSTDTGSYIFELDGIDALNVEYITFTNAHTGIYADSGKGSNVRITESRFVNNEQNGIFLSDNISGLIVEGSLFSGSNDYGSGRQAYGIRFEGSSGTFRGNTFLNNYQYAIYLRGGYGSINTNLVENNIVVGGISGIYARLYQNNTIIQMNSVSGTTSEGIVIGGTGNMATGNILHDNNIGISVYEGAKASYNTQVYDNSIGILVYRNAEASHNITFNNTEGIRTNSGGYTLLKGNTAYGNTIGFRFNHTTQVEANLAYNNEGGFFADDIGNNSQWRGTFINNIAHNNTLYALRIENTVGTPQVLNNTLLQNNTGAAVVLDDSPDVTFKNNIVVTENAPLLSISLDSQSGFSADYNVYHSNGTTALFEWGTRSYASKLEWFYNVAVDAHSVFADPLFVDAAAFNFQVSSNSPAIDAGHPDDSYLLEPKPSGHRVNAGAYGNTASATLSASQSIQILNPVDLDKLLQSTPTTIDFISSGLINYQALAAYNVGNDTAVRWPATQPLEGRRETIRDTIDVSQISEPAPVEVYTENYYTNYGPGNSIEFEFNLPPGEYIVRLHFVEISTGSQNQFDVALNDTIVLSDYSIYETAGGPYIATVEEAPLTVSSDGSVSLVVSAKVNYGKIAGVEFLRANPLGIVNPTVSAEVSYDNGNNFSTIATGITVNNRGYGAFEWTPSQPSSGRSAQIRITSDNNASIYDISPNFVISNSDSNYYINDSSTDNDVITSSIGDNANSGKSPSEPMASIEALLTVYTFSPGDVIHIDSGTYQLTRNIVLSASESGITIVGAYDPANPLAKTILDRGDSANTAFAIELMGVDNLTIQHLTLQNGYAGLYAADGQTSNLTIRNSTFLENHYYGIFVGSDNSGLTVENSHFEGSGNYSTGRQHHGIKFDGTNGYFDSNVFINNYAFGIYLNGQSNATNTSVVENNSVSLSREGIYAPRYQNNTQILHNTVTQAESTAIYLSGNGSVVKANSVFGNNVGIRVERGSVATENIVVHENVIGIYVGYEGSAINNIVYDNTEGVRARTGVPTLVKGNTAHNNTVGFRFDQQSYLVGNTAYANSGGFWADSMGSNSAWSGVMKNNLAYNNSDYALYLKSTVHSPKVYNNTFVQAGAEATAVILNNAPNVVFMNNIVSVDASRGIEVDLASQDGFTANYNLYHSTTADMLFTWASEDLNSIADWYFASAQDKYSQSADPKFVDPSANDYHLQSSSPAIDAGHPEWTYVKELEPSGNRLNIGAYGNTGEAATSQTHSISILTPNYLDKPELNGETDIRFLTSGFLEQQSVAWFNAGASAIGGWSSLTDVTGATNLSSQQTVDTSLVLNPAPEAVYQEAFRSVSYSSNRMEIPLQLQPGNYLLRLHFARTNNSNYTFDIEFDGTLLQQDYSITADLNTAIVEEFAVTVDSSGLASLALVSQNGYSLISGIEVVRVYDPKPFPNPEFNMDISFDDGNTFNPLFSGLGVDIRGMGNATWLPAIENPQMTTLLRITEQNTTIPASFSNAFMVVNDGNEFFVNKLLDTEDAYTSAAGQNLTGSGKDPDSPMASLEALLSVHAPSYGDIVYVDADTYYPSRNIILDMQHSGITIKGAVDHSDNSLLTTLDRNNTLSYAHAFTIYGADDVVVDSLTITNASTGISVAQYMGDNLTVRNSKILFNQNYGIYMDLYNSGLSVIDSYFEGYSEYVANRQSTGIYTYSDSVLIENASFINHYSNAIDGQNIKSDNPSFIIRDSFFEGGGNSTAIADVRAHNVIVSNSIFSNGKQDGLYLSGSANLIIDSAAFGNQDAGFYIYNDSDSSILNSTAYNNNIGIYASNGTLVQANHVLNNAGGIYLFNATANKNTAYNNSSYGIAGAYGSVMTRNQVFDNEIGIIGDRYNNSRSFTGLIANNLIYLNNSIAVSVEQADDNFLLSNNTIQQETGTALHLRLIESGQIFNNIVILDTGFIYDIDTPTIPSTLSIDHNLFQLNENANGRIASVGETFVDTLQEWQALTNRESVTTMADPLFFDIDGADDLLGYTQVNGIFINGGADDNYHILKNSPAIDAGQSWSALRTDHEDQLREDDPGTVNIGSSRYKADVLNESLFDENRGTAQDWNSIGALYTLTLPFTFSFYGKDYSQLQVSTYGYIGFPNLNLSSTDNSQSALIQRTSIAALWDNLDTRWGEGRDIFVDTSIAGEVYIRFQGYHRTDGTLIQFAYLLKDDGSFRFDYGTGNANLSPTVGISAGNNTDYLFIPQYDGATDLTNTHSISISQATGITDIGAYEFVGDSTDTASPTILSTYPTAIENEENYFGFLNSIDVTFSEKIDSIDVRSAATYTLYHDSNADGLFNEEDTLYAMVPSFDSATGTVQLLVVNGPLPDGDYQFVIRSNNLRDTSGNQLDGNADGQNGRNYQRNFSVQQPNLPNFTSASSYVGILNDPFSFVISADKDTLSYSASGLPSGLQIDASSGHISGTPTEIGVFSVNVSATNSDGTSSDTLQLSILPVPTVTAVYVNEGAAHRSMLQRIQIKIDQNISRSLSASDVVLMNRDTGLPVPDTQVQISWSFQTGTLQLSFTGMQGGSLPDGNYRILIESGELSANGVALDGDNNGIKGGTLSVDFHRFFGDSNGNRNVDTLDGIRFRNSYLSQFGDANYAAYFDVNGDGKIDTVDKSAFESNYRKSLSLPDSPNPTRAGMYATPINTMESPRFGTIAGNVLLHSILTAQLNHLPRLELPSIPYMGPIHIPKAFGSVTLYRLLPSEGSLLLIDDPIQNDHSEPQKETHPSNPLVASSPHDSGIFSLYENL